MVRESDMMEAKLPSKKAREGGGRWWVEGKQPCAIGRAVIRHRAGSGARDASPVWPSLDGCAACSRRVRVGLRAHLAGERGTKAA
jgi:hypothetical protein